MYSSPIGRGTAAPKKVTAPDVRARKGGPALAMVTAYDFTMARLLDEAGVDLLLVGDSLGMVVQGLANTLPVTLDEVAYHSRAVARAAGRAHVVADMPFMSYQVSSTQAVESAGKLVKEGGCESVKLEGGEDFAEHAWRIVRAGIPVMGHVGLMPQSVHALGGFKVQGRGDGAEAKVLADAKALEEAGAYAIVLEAIPPDLAAKVTASVGVAEMSARDTDLGRLLQRLQASPLHPEPDRACRKLEDHLGHVQQEHVRRARSGVSA